MIAPRILNPDRRARIEPALAAALFIFAIGAFWTGNSMRAGTETTVAALLLFGRSQAPCSR